MKQSSGCLLINKRVGLTSRDEVNIVSKALNIKKCGHIGTLDPFASGLLIILVNNATKISPFLEEEDKTYVAKLKLGSATDTGDLEGKVIENQTVPTLKKKEIEDVLNSFLGEMEQLPPMFSALKYNGKHYYDYARKGEIIERKTRKIKIYEIRLLSYQDDEITFITKVSKGTYIRTLGEDIAKKLNTVGHLVALERTAIGQFNLKDSISDDEVDETKLISIDKMLTKYKKVILNKEDAFKAKNGMRLKLAYNDEHLLLEDEEGIIAIYKKENEHYRCLRGLR